MGGDAGEVLLFEEDSDVMIGISDRDVYTWITSGCTATQLAPSISGGQSRDMKQRCLGEYDVCDGGIV